MRATGKHVQLSGPRPCQLSYLGKPSLTSRGCGTEQGVAHVKQPAHRGPLGSQPAVCPRPWRHQKADGGSRPLRNTSLSHTHPATNWRFAWGPCRELGGSHCRGKRSGTSLSPDECQRGTTSGALGPDSTPANPAGHVPWPGHPHQTPEWPWAEPQPPVSPVSPGT